MKLFSLCFLQVSSNEHTPYINNQQYCSRNNSDMFLDLSSFQTAFLEVVIPPDIIYEETSGDLMVPEGGSAKLVCKARGFPKPRVVWRREDGGEIILRGGPSTKTRGQYFYEPHYSTMCHKNTITFQQDKMHPNIINYVDILRDLFGKIIALQVYNFSACFIRVIIV